ncbi:MAG: helix-hairpin-helix domain-containing protein [Acidobacteriota bacterium]|nr:helix-hairpin-helix domain-containing protein [Acidobacteriota bacterium]
MAGSATSGARRPDEIDQRAEALAPADASLNAAIAARLDEVAALLQEQGANPFRVRAYRRGAAAVRRLPASVSHILDADGLEGLERLQGIGVTLARVIRDIVRFGYSPMLERMRGDLDPMHLLATVPGIGRRIAGRLHDELGLETLEDLEAAAYDGRLESLAGFGPKRLAGVRAVLAERLGRVRIPPSGRVPPTVAELLDVDREYREQAAADRLPRIAPRRFNPEGRRWLPVLHTARGARHYTALFSNTERAHRLGTTGDWVVIYGDRGRADGQWTVVTAPVGPLAGRRVVRGREAECATYYDRRRT